MPKEAVDFNNPEALAEDLAGLVAEAAGEKAPKAKKVAKPKTVTCLNCGTIFEVPKSISSRGVVSGLALEEMNEDQLKIEYRNANSVAYKTKKNPNAKPESIEKTEARLAAVKAEMDKKGIAPTGRSKDVTAATIAELIKSGKISLEDLQAQLDKQA